MTRQGVMYANAYITDRVYGGPEEGGWYYDCGEPVMSLPFIVDMSEGVSNALAADLAIESLYDMCVAAGIDTPEKDFFSQRDWNIDGFKFFIEFHPGTPFPKKRPHWDMGEDY